MCECLANHCNVEMSKQQSTSHQLGNHHAAAPEPPTGQTAQHELLRLLRREVRRTERTGIPLSIAILRLASVEGGGPDLARVSEMVRESSRETDVAFRIDPGLVVVVLLDTDLAGAEAFARKILSQAGRIPISAETEECPGPWSEHLLAGGLILVQNPQEPSARASGAAARSLPKRALAKLRGG